MPEIAINAAEKDIFKMKNIEIGQRAKVRGEEYLICQCDFSKVVAVDMETGNRWDNPVTVTNVYEINQKELEQIFADIDLEEVVIC